MIEELLLPASRFGQPVWVIVKDTEGLSAKYSRVESGLRVIAYFKKKRCLTDFRLRNTRTGELVMGAIL